MKKSFLIAGAAAVLGLTALLSGCGSYNGSFVRSSGLRAMKKMYGKEFTYLCDARSGGDVFGRHSDALDIYAECSDLAGKKIRIYSPDGVHFGSDYIPVKFEDETKEYIRTLAEEIYDDGGLRIETTYYVNDLGKDTTLAQYLASGYLDWVKILTTDNDDPEGDYSKLMERLIENGVNCRPAVYHFTENVYAAEDFDIGSTNAEYNDQKFGWVSPEGIYPTLDSKFDKKYKFKKYF